MSFTFIRQLPSPDEVKALEPMSEEMKQIKNGRDRLIRDVITGKSDKFLVIVGPCSADNEDAVCEYTNRLAKVQEKVADRLVLVPRIYTKSIQISPVLRARDTRGCYISRTLRQNRISWQESLRSAICTSAPSQKQALLRRMRCSTRTTGTISPTFSPM